MKTRKEIILESVLNLLEAPEGYRRPMKGPGKPSEPDPRFADKRTKQEIAKAVEDRNNAEWRRLAMRFHEKGTEPKTDALGYRRIMDHLRAIREEEGNKKGNQ